SWIVRTYWVNEVIHLARGNWSLAREYSNRALSVLPNDPRTLYSRTILEYVLGNFEEGEAYLKRLLDTVGRVPPGPTAEHAVFVMAASIAGWITGRSDWSQVAENAAAVVLNSPSVTPLLSIITRPGLGLMAAQRGDVAEASELYDALKSSPQIYLAILSTRVLGLLARTLGTLEEAVAHFEDALTFCRNGGLEPELGWICFDYAETLLQRDSTGNRRKAVSLLDESLKISGELGMKPLVERVLSKREILKA
ncbi:MAG: hypothetical protein ACE5KI_07490, partial [Dehalococcoidia bacterium]